jgi:DNA-binding transcriptional LysR family regulator
MDMDIQQLVTLQKVAKEQSFSRASKELGITQPTATMRIKTLEEEVGETLIVRTGQKAILTPAGEVFLKYAGRALQVFQSGKDKTASGDLDNTLTIAGTPTFNTYVLPQMLKSFHRLHPHFQWRIHTGSTEHILQIIVDEVADVGLVRDTITHPKVYSYPLYPDELRLIVPNHHPFAMKEYITISELKEENILIYRRNSETWALIEERFIKAGIEPKVTMDLDHIVTVKQMVLSGAGIAFVPSMAAKDAISEGLLSTVRLEGPPILRHMSIIIGKRQPNIALSAFLRYLHDIFQPDHIPVDLKEKLAVTEVIP